MSDSAPHPDPTCGQSSSPPARRHQRQQQQLQQQQHQRRASQPHTFYTPSHPSQPSFSTNIPGQYSMSSPTSLYSQLQLQHQYTFPQLSIPQMSPPLSPAHSHASPEFYTMGRSTTPSQPPLVYAPPFHTSAPLQSSGSPPAFDYEGAWNSVPSPSTPTSSPYLSQQPLTSFNFHPTLTATPQFTHSPPFSPPFPAHHAQQSQQTQYPPPYVTRTTSASPTAGPYPSMYYVDAYGNPSNPASGLGQGFQSLPSPSLPRPLHPPAFSHRDPATSTGLDSEPGSGIGTTGDPHRPSEGARKPDSVNTPSSQAPPSPFGHGESVSERGHQQQQMREARSRQNIHRSHLPNPPAQRSEWVMWVGSVPSDATHDELWRFFTRPVASSPVGPPFPYHRQLQQPPHLPGDLLSPSGSSSASDTDTADASGVQSVFLIARSNCAFVNYSSAAHLAAAVKRFNGIQLRPNDPSCPRLVCRIRGKEEDQTAGVGAQRGTGVHTRWVRDQRERDKTRELVKRAWQREGESTDVETSASEPPSTPTEIEKESSAHGSGRRAPDHSGSSGDTTTSGFLEHHFPKRYFILKSLSQDDLDISVEKGGWATQPHNETVLNKAFRNSTDVFLIFSVNRSGEFFGYARMASLMGEAADRVPWASRTASHHSQHSHSPAVSSVSGDGSQVNEMNSEENVGSLPEGQQGDMSEGKERDPEKGKGLVTPSEHRMAVDSPQPVTPATQKRLTSTEKVGIVKVALSATGRYTAPPSDRRYDMYKDSLIQSGDSRSLARPTPSTSAPTVMYSKSTNSLFEGLTSETIDPRLFPHYLPEIRLDSKTLLSALSEDKLRGPGEGQPGFIDRAKCRDTFYSPAPGFESIPAESTQLPTGEDLQSASGDARRSSRAQEELQMQGEHAGLPTHWGSPFKVQWLRVKKLPFTRTRHLRNPWNHEREVKVSRDGTELEPSVGQALLDEWDKEEPPGPETTLATGGGDSASTASASAVGRRSVLHEDHSHKHRPPR